MRSVKKCWITPGDGGLVTLSLESSHTMPEYRRIQVEQTIHPVTVPMADRRHVVMLPTMTCDDLEKIRDTINEYLYSQYHCEHY